MHCVGFFSSTFCCPTFPRKVYTIHCMYNVIKTIILLNFRFSCLPLLHSNGSFSNRLLHRMPLNKICSRYVHRGNKIVHLKGTVSWEKCSNWECGGLDYVLLMCRIHFYHLYTLPLICYDCLKTTFVEVKRISPLCKPPMHVTVSV